MEYLLNPKNWWLPLLIIFVISLSGVFMMGLHPYTEAPPVPDYMTKEGKTIITKQDIQNGQTLFQKYALMEYGSMFGDGAYRGPEVWFIVSNRKHLKKIITSHEGNGHQENGYSEAVLLEKEFNLPVKS
ncbi:MAG: hypothetical protein AABY93_07860 [Bacteroidota bacterium]